MLVTSIGCDDPLFPLNLYWGVLLWKKQGEVALQRSGLDYTIVRPGGLGPGGVWRSWGGQYNAAGRVIGRRRVRCAFVAASNQHCSSRCSASPLPPAACPPLQLQHLQAGC